MNGLTARDVMNADVITIQKNKTVKELSTLLTEHWITGAPVVNDEDNLVGVVSLTDIAKNVNETDVAVDNSNPRYDVRGWENKMEPEELEQCHIEKEGMLVEDIMTSLPLTVPETTTVPEIADIMVEGRVHRLLVTRNRQLMGIITTLDVLKLFQSVR